ncbi:MAG: hypothetical protein EOP85_18510, partial [Verrucomicrobiaceae bacterium]
PAPLIGAWALDNNPSDSVGSNPATVFGGPGYVAGKVGQAIDLDGTDDYVDIPDPIGRLRETTIATWVNWDGGGDWQRIFDFGTGVDQYLCLTPKSGGGNLRLVLKDALNYRDQEFQVNAPTLVTGQWVHLAAVVRENYMTLYLNGKAVGSTFGINRSLADFPAVNNYIGKSQYPDPYFNGRIDDFRVFGKALDGAEIWSLWGESANRGPSFTQPVFNLPAADALQPFAGFSLAPYATDPDNDTLTFSKLNGPAWLTVNANGTLSGQPGPGTSGDNTFVVRVTDPSGASSDATVTLMVSAPIAAPVTFSVSPPASDADDVSFIATNINEPDTIDGTSVASENDESTMLAKERTSKGQTFTTGTNPQGYIFQSMSFQCFHWTQPRAL